MLKIVLATAALVSLSAASAFAADAELGKKQAGVCTACHTFGDGQPNKIGPNLHGVFGRKAGSKDDYLYTDGMKNYGVTWNDAEIDKWITNPKAILPGTKMVFPGQPDPEARANIIAFLKIATK